MTHKVRKAVIPAAGLGTRFLPATKAVPKEMFPIVDVPTIQYIVQEAVDAGVEQVILVTARGKSAVEDHFDHAPELEELLDRQGKTDLAREVRKVARMAEVVAVRQGSPLGLGHAVLCARRVVGDEPFAVLLGDDIIDGEPPCIGQLIDVFTERQASVVALQQVSPEETTRYGIIEGPQVSPRLYRIARSVEKPRPEDAPSTLAIVGRYVLAPEIFDLLANTRPGAIGEIQLTDGLDALARREALYGYEFSGQRYDAGEKLGLLQATLHYALKRPDLADRLRGYLRGVVAGFPPDPTE